MQVYIPSRYMWNLGTGIKCCHSTKHTQPWELLGVVDAAVPYFWGAPAPTLRLRHPAWGRVGRWPGDRSCLCRPTAVLPCGWMLKLVGSPTDGPSLVTACAPACESGFSLISHLQTRAGSLPCDTPSFRGEEMAFEHRRALAAPAPVAWIRNLQAAWWMLLLLTQISGWMFH